MTNAMRAVLAAPLALASTNQTVFYNCSVRTRTDVADAFAAALCFEGDRIVAASSLARVDAACPSAMRIDLGGAHVVPGLTDSHCHVMLEAARRRSADLSNCSDADACAKAMAAFETDEEPWVLGFGFDQTAWPGGAWPDKGDLDERVADRPARADHVSGHAAWVNTKALAAAKITRETADPVGGRILRDAAGEPTGILTDNAVNLVDAVVPPPTLKAVDASVDATLNAMASHGLAGVHDLAALPGDLDYYVARARAGTLTARLNVYRDAAAHGFEAPPLPWADESPLVHCRGAKFFADGAMGSWSAHMLQPYSDKNTTGTRVYGDAELRGNVTAWRRAGYQVSAHAIGDAAIRQVLDAYEAAGVEGDERFRVEHVQILDAADVPRFADLGVIPAMQPSHVASRAAKG